MPATVPDYLSNALSTHSVCIYFAIGRFADDDNEEHYERSLRPLELGYDLIRSSYQTLPRQSRSVPGSSGWPPIMMNVPSYQLMDLSYRYETIGKLMAWEIRIEGQTEIDAAAVDEFKVHCADCFSTVSKQEGIAVDYMGARSSRTYAIEREEWIEKLAMPQ